MITNAARQPNASASGGMIAGANTAPMFAPELKMPVASARSRRGNHSAVVLIAAGKLPPSPMPSSARTIAKPVTEPTAACSIAAMLQTSIASA